MFGPFKDREQSLSKRDHAHGDMMCGARAQEEIKRFYGPGGIGLLNELKGESPVFEVPSSPEA